jgi:DNA-directed RNA polymerase specialized sigma24 family protein
MTERPPEPRPFRHAGLAMMVAKHFYIPGMDLDDLFQEACLSMIRCEPRWDPSRGKVSTFLHRCAWNDLNKIRQGLGTKMRTPPMGGVTSLQTPVGEHCDELVDMLEAPSSDPALIVEQRDTIRRALAEPSLSPGERKCLVAASVGAEPHEVGYSRALAFHARLKIKAAA